MNLLFLFIQKGCNQCLLIPWTNYLRQKNRYFSC